MRRQSSGLEKAPHLQKEPEAASTDFVRVERVPRPLPWPGYEKTATLKKHVGARCSDESHREPSPAEITDRAVCFNCYNFWFAILARTQLMRPPYEVPSCRKPFN
jgi:hypothetical protein